VEPENRGIFRLLPSSFHTSQRTAVGVGERHRIDRAGIIYYTAREIATTTSPSPSPPRINPADPTPITVRSFARMPARSIGAVHRRRRVRWLRVEGRRNSRKIPTILWLQRLRADGLALVGERREILRNDAPWEGAVVEGPFGCAATASTISSTRAPRAAGKNCNYALGVAAGEAMTGPWEKSAANPLLAGNDAWRCPGHGSIVTDPDGRYWLLYHAYAQKGIVATGASCCSTSRLRRRRAWPAINRGKGRACAPPARRPRRSKTTPRLCATISIAKASWASAGNG